MYARLSMKINLFSLFDRVNQVYNLYLEVQRRPWFSANNKGTLTYPLYPYHDMEIAVFFIYEKDFTRRMNISSIPNSIQTIIGLIMLLMSLATVVLCFIRRKLELRRSNLILSFIDTLITFIGGGNVRMQHKIVSWFFGILWIGTFFITSVFSGDLVDYFTSIFNQEVSTFEQLAQINPRIVVADTLLQYRERIHGMFRFAIFNLLCFKFPNDDEFICMFPVEKWEII